MAFYECTSLSTVIFSDNIRSLGSSAFAGCKALTTIVNLGFVKSKGTGALFEVPVSNSGDVASLHWSPRNTNVTRMVVSANAETMPTFQ